MITPLSDALAERGYLALTDVQEAVTAPELANADLLVSAQTGSGKTVGFGLAIASTLLGEAESMPPPAAPLALVIAPTRELALQVQRELAWLYQKTGAWVVSCIGGMDARNERRALERGAHIVVGTPGRLRDHIERGALDLGDIRAIVLDEADEMLDLGFREDLEFMLGSAPADRRTLMFSATVPPSIAELAKSFQRDAVRVTTLTKGQQHADIEYQAIQVSASDTEHAIINLLRFHDAQTVIVFANTRATVARLTARFANRGFAVVSLSGELSQDERSHALQALRDGRARVCVATDVAARGIDLPNLELVIHADLPTNTEGLLHRSGRTGRAGRKGISALIVPDKAVSKASRLLKWAKIEAKWGFAPTPEEIREKDEARLLADPAWDALPTGDEAAFAAKLLGRFNPEQIAVACLRLYQARLSAPEELNAPKAKGDRGDRRDTFGPSAWVSLSIGRDRNAEPRWLLPMLCRAGNLEKTQIGKIRVTETETFVELSQAAMPDFLQKLGANSTLEDDIRVEQVDGLPETATQRPAQSGPDRSKQRAHRGAETGEGAPAQKRPAKWGRTLKPREGGQPTEPKSPQKAISSVGKPQKETRTPSEQSDTPYDKGGKASRKPSGAKRAGDKPFGKKPGKAAKGQSAEGAGRYTSGAKPKGKPAKGSPAKHRGASDPSVPLDRPGRTSANGGGKTADKPAFKVKGKGGNSPPRRKR